MTQTPSASRRIIDEVTSWPGVEASLGDRGELAFKVGRREIGHLHGDYAAHFGFPREAWAELRRLNYDRLVARHGLPATNVSGDHP